MNGENSQKKDITFDEIAFALAKDYDSIYIIDSENDSYVRNIFLNHSGKKQLPRFLRTASHSRSITG